MEIKLRHLSSARRRLTASLLAVAAIAGLAAIGPELAGADSTQPVTTGGTGTTGITGTTADPNDYACSGTLAKGTPESGTPGTQVQYQFSCNGPITGYQIDTEPHQILYYDASPVLTVGGTPSTDNFECQGITPGYAINCVGQSTVAYEQVTGQFTIPGKLTTEPRVDAILTVTEATAPATTVTSASKTAPVTVTPTVTQYMSGPFDLGRPDDLTGDAFSGSTRLGNTPPVEVLVKKGKGGAWITTVVPLDGTTGDTGLYGAAAQHKHSKPKH
jgi:hypothetical protein